MHERKVLEKLGLKWTIEPMALSRDFGVGYNLKEILKELNSDDDDFVICGECGERVPFDCDGRHELKRVYEI